MFIFCDHRGLVGCKMFPICDNRYVTKLVYIVLIVKQKLHKYHASMHGNGMKLSYEATWFHSKACGVGSRSGKPSFYKTTD